MKVVLGIDLGTSALKATLVAEDGSVLKLTTASYPTALENPSVAEQSPLDWISGCRRAVRELLQHAEASLEVVGIGVTGQMHGLVALGADGDALRPAVLWSDARGGEFLDELLEYRSVSQWMSSTGSRPNVSFQLIKILWLRKNEPEIWGQVRHLLLPKDYLRLYLTGRLFTDPSDAAGTLLYDLSSRDWDTRLLLDFGLPLSLLPPISNSDGVAGVLTEQSANQLGLSEGIPVVCGCGDAIAQLFAVHQVEPRAWLCNIGTSGQVMSNAVERFTVDCKGRVHTLPHAHRDKWALMGATLTAGGSLEWYRKRVASHLAADEAWSNRLDKCALDTAPLFLPYLAGERTPHMDKSAKGAFVGLSLHHDAVDLAYSVMEGVLFSLREAYESILALGLHPAEEMYLVGGSAQYPVWQQLAADVFEMPIGVGLGRAGAAYGAALLAAVAVGFSVSTGELQKSLRVVHPRVERAKSVGRRYGMYRQLYPKLVDVFHDLDITST